VLTQVENKMIIRPTPTATAEQEEKQINNQSSTQNWLRKREVRGEKKEKVEWQSMGCSRTTIAVDLASEFSPNIAGLGQAKNSIQQWN